MLNALFHAWDEVLGTNKGLYKDPDLSDLVGTRGTRNAARYSRVAVSGRTLYTCR